MKAMRGMERAKQYKVVFPVNVNPDSGTVMSLSSYVGASEKPTSMACEKQKLAEPRHVSQ